VETLKYDNNLRFNENEITNVKLRFEVIYKRTKLAANVAYAILIASLRKIIRFLYNAGALKFPVPGKNCSSYLGYFELPMGSVGYDTTVHIGIMYAYGRT